MYKFYLPKLGSKFEQFSFLSSRAPRRQKVRLQSQQGTRKITGEKRNRDFKSRSRRGRKGSVTAVGNTLARRNRSVGPGYHLTGPTLPFTSRTPGHGPAPSHHPSPEAQEARAKTADRCQHGPQPVLLRVPGGSPPALQGEACPVELRLLVCSQSSPVGRRIRVPTTSSDMAPTCFLPTRMVRTREDRDCVLNTHTQELNK